MTFNNKVPEWNARGSEPPQSLKDSGFAAGYKPPAAYFNWFWHDVSACLKELQESTEEIGCYTDISQLGLSSNVFLSSDFKGNIAKIADALQWRSFTLRLHLSYNELRALFNSIQEKLKTDLGIESNQANNWHMFIRGQLSESTETGTILIDVVDEAGSAVGRVCSCVFIRGLVGDYMSNFIYSQHPSGFLPLDGSAGMTGNGLGLLSGKSKVTAGNDFIQLENYKGNAGDTSNRRVLALKSSNDVQDALQIVDWSSGRSNYYKVHGAHNKPSASYTGNGNATSRTISTGGSGNLLCVTSSTGILCFVFKWGAVSFATSNDITWYSASEIMFESGVLTLKSTANAVNKSGTTYNYQVL